MQIRRGFIFPTKSERDRTHANTDEKKRNLPKFWAEIERNEDFEN